MTDVFQPVLDALRPGAIVYIQGASGESRGLYAAFAANRERCRGVHFVSCLLPGINEFNYAALHEESMLTTFLSPSALQNSFKDKRVRTLPLSYTGITNYLATIQIDIGIFHVSAPNAEKRASFGIASDFGPVAWPHAKKRILLANKAMPFLKHAPQVDVEQADMVVEIDDPLVEAADGAPPPTTTDITRQIVSLIPDCATVQTGIGGVPGATLAALSGKRDLKIHSGVINDGFMILAEAGALMRNHVHTTGIAFGSRRLYDFLSSFDALAFAPVTETHSSQRLSAIETLIAVNSALEVDLFGQVNLEWKGSKLISGVGGAPDFVRGALASRGGKSIIALPAAANAGATRIVPKLSAPAVSLSRDLADHVVTQYGTAMLRNLSPSERATALISIAHPEYRAPLTSAWREIRNSL